MPSKVQLIGGLFQDAEGNVLANGYLKFKLNQDGTVTGVGSICSGIEITIRLNSSGSVDTGTPQFIWGNDQILPVNSYYRVTGYTAAGQPAWGPNNQQVNGNGGTYDVGQWVPNAVISWTPPIQPLLLETNGTPNSLQSIQNLSAGSGITLAEASGTVTITSSGTPLTLKTNGVNNTSQTVLNLKSGTGVSLAADGVGGVTVTNSSIATPSLGLPMDKDWSVYTMEITGGGASPTGVPVAIGDFVSAFIWSTGTVGILPPTSGHGVVWEAASNSAAGVGSISSAAGIAGATPKAYSDRAVTYAARFAPLVAFDGTTNQNRVWAGVCNASTWTSGGQPGYDGFIGSDTPTTFKFVAFYWNPLVASNWQCKVGNGSAITTVDSGVLGTLGTYYNLKFTTTGSAATFFINGVQVASINTNFPSATPMTPMILSTPANSVGTNGSGKIVIEYMYVDCVRN